MRLSLLAAGLLALAVSACWLPDRFLSEVRVGRDGSYAVTYKGDMVWVPMIKDLRAGTLTDDQILEKMEVLQRDLSRDSAFKTIEVIQPGRFRVYYETSGRLSDKDEFTFLRRNNAIVTIQTDGSKMVVRGAAMTPTQKSQIRDSGLSFSGKFRVVSDALPVRGNPQKRGSRGYKNFRVYDWTVDGMDSALPYIEFDRSRQP